MPVKVKCSGCETVLNAPDRARGKAVKCPKCGTAVRVPAGQAVSAKKRPASVASGDSSEFFASFDVSRVEDRNTRVCPKCGVPVGPEDVDCPACGADLVTGGLGATQRARAGRKGAAPSEYYGHALKDAGKYVGKKQGLAWKSVLVCAIFGVLALGAWLMVAWCHNLPPQVFWVFVATVLTLLVPGWLWIVQNQLIRRTLNTKEEKYPVRFEPFIAVSLGIKAVAWSLLFGLPIWLLLGTPGLVMIKNGAEAGPVLLGVAGGLFALLALISWPVAQGHFVMPITSPGWMVHKVLPDVGRNIGPLAYWATFVVLTAVPLAGVAAGGWFLAAPKLTSHIDTLAYNSSVRADKQAVELADPKRGGDVSEAQKMGAQRELREENWTLALWPAAAIIATAVPLGFWAVYNARTAAFLVKLFKANMTELVAHEREYVYVAKTQEEREKQAEASKSWTTVFASVAVVVAIGLAGGMVYATFADGVGYLRGLGVGLGATGTVAAWGAVFGIAKEAWGTSPGWAIAIVFVPFALLIYCIQHWQETKLQFVTLVLSNVVALIGSGMIVAGAVSELPAA